MLEEQTGADVDELRGAHQQALLLGQGEQPRVGQSGLLCLGGPGQTRCRQGQGRPTAPG
ncbi:hypothetical protein [Streptomyces sp. TLI_171]|uniref:hypothetical protein n=1 Tax=Streptomyces sp. TLI_171 TaxID=1938859 RepID=UPI0015D5448E|nr:hypothetical protein [Streptomyces sp. TLI_171]